MRLRGGLPLAVLVVLLVAVPIVEVYLLIQVGQRIGLLPTIALLVLEAVLGGWLLRREGSRAWRALDAAFRGGRMPTGELTEAGLVLVGGVLLMLPGFLSDVIGLFFLVPFTRPFARKVVGFFVARRLSRSGIAPGLFGGPRRPGAQGDPSVVEGEVVPDDTSETVVSPREVDGGRPQA
ncbi:UPF0716 protein FxsA [Microlunatus sagamiharensis]|uniref:UPF0716 protein FxsA n=1 Tax=Microlunatus sagamiharensis TaxID=546874 RepID=A0A1H2M6R9_9ACTN|nr:FxsA family protein [Microlunatus sagamiharensis]SDU88186.1 UPF0716 protein FxsA [Microlunatus sagamiharensis]